MSDLYSVYFTNITTGYATGLYGTIIKTVDGGTTWTSETSGTLEDLNSVFFPEANIGYIVGGSGTILKTTDAGTTWTSYSVGGDDELQATYFTDSNTGYAVGGSAILKTTDGGMSWVGLTHMTINSLHSVYFTNSNTGYVVGEYGTILMTTDGGTDFIEETRNSQETFIIYPNPAKESITIERTKFKTENDGSLSVYSMVGQLLIQQKMQGHKTEIDISSLPFGIYFVKYVSNGFTETGKFVKD